MLKHTPLLALACFCCLYSLPAGAITIEGVEFSDPLVFDVAQGAHFSLSTSEDIYVFAPNDLEGADITIHVGGTIVAAVAIQLIGDTIDLCTLDICSPGPFDLDQDVVVRVFDPIGDFTLTAGGSVVLSTLPIPEPATALLVSLGLLALATRRAPVTRA
jgi:hypothetical protein